MLRRQNNKQPSYNTQNASSSSLYELLRIPGDPDPDFTISAAPDECSDDLYEDQEEYDVDENELLEELGDTEVSDSDITIMGLALYDALMKDDDETRRRKWKKNF